MAKLIRIDRKLARRGGRLVTDANGAPCCCGGGGLFYRFTLCECSGTPGIQRYWTDQYQPSMGCVYGEFDGKCYYICPDAQTKETLGALDVLRRPTLIRVADAEEACLLCCEGTGDGCCDQNTIGCGLTRADQPFVTMRTVPSVSLNWERSWCDPCLNITESFSQPWASKLANNSGNIACCDGIRDFYGESVIQKYRWCNSQFQDDFTHFMYGTGGYCLLNSVEASAPYDLGYSSGSEAVRGTVRNLTGPYLWGELTFGCGFFADSFSATVRAAVSMRHPAHWWVYIRQGYTALSASASVTYGGGCGGPFTVNFNASNSVGYFCPPGVQKYHPNDSSGSIEFTFFGIGDCDGFTGSSDDALDNLPPDGVSGGGTGGVAPPGETFRDRVKRLYGGCQDCGKRVEGGGG